MIVEFQERRYKIFVVCFLLMMDAFSYLLIILLFKFTKDANLLEIIGISLNVLAIFGIWWLPETPEFLYNRMRFREAKKVLKRIARFNRVEDYEGYFEFDTEADYNQCKMIDITVMGDLR
jgi:hypothetical protein